MPSYKASLPAGRPDHVEPGEYTVEIVSASESMSARGHVMIEMKLRTEAGSHLYDFLVFTPTAFWKIDLFRAAIGDQVVEGEDTEVNPDMLIGRTGRVRLGTEEYKGRTRNRVEAWIAPLPGAQPGTFQRREPDPF
jgi:hypothetical protein